MSKEYSDPESKSLARKWTENKRLVIQQTSSLNY